MANSIKELRKQMKPEVRQAARAKAVEIITEMSLAEARRSRGLGQKIIAQVMKIRQPNVSQIERRPDALVSTLDQYIEALGGKLEIRAKFPDGQDVEITQFKHS